MKDQSRAQKPHWSEVKFESTKCAIRTKLSKQNLWRFDGRIQMV